MKELADIEEQLRLLEEGIRKLDREMPMSDEEQGEYVFECYEACNAIQKAVDKLKADKAG